MTGWRNWASFRIYPEGKKFSSLSPWGPDCLPLLAVPCTYNPFLPGTESLTYNTPLLLPSLDFHLLQHNEWLAGWDLQRLPCSCALGNCWAPGYWLTQGLCLTMARRKEHIWPSASSAFQDYLILCLGLIFRFLICVSRKDSCQANLNNHLYKDRSPEQ